MGKFLSFLNYLELYPESIKCWGIGFGSLFIGIAALIASIKVAL